MSRAQDDRASRCGRCGKLQDGQKGRDGKIKWRGIEPYSHKFSQDVNRPNLDHKTAIDVNSGLGITTICSVPL